VYLGAPSHKCRWQCPGVKGFADFDGGAGVAEPYGRCHASMCSRRAGHPFSHLSWPPQSWGITRSRTYTVILPLSDLWAARPRLGDCHHSAKRLGAAPLRVFRPAPSWPMRITADNAMLRTTQPGHRRQPPDRLRLPGRPQSAARRPQQASRQGPGRRPGPISARRTSVRTLLVRRCTNVVCPPIDVFEFISVNYLKRASYLLIVQTSGSGITIDAYAFQELLDFEVIT
jgi:hypothetical protein